MNKHASLMVGHEGKDAMYVQSLVYNRFIISISRSNTIYSPKVEDVKK